MDSEDFKTAVMRFWNIREEKCFMGWSCWFWIFFALVSAIEFGYQVGQGNNYKIISALAEFAGCGLLATARYLDHLVKLGR